MLRAALGLLLLGVWSLAGGTTYYVSSSTGSNNNDGLTELTAFETIDHVNQLSLQPGDEVLFRCGDEWNGEMLIITQSGTLAQPIRFGSYPADCVDQPIISGAHPVSGWVLDSGSIYRADLGAGANAGLFDDGINQLFRDGVRLTMGRWPNPGEGEAGDGYSRIEGPAGNSAQIQDNQLPPGNWSGAVAHIKGMRWYILNREVTGSSGTTLNLAVATDCWAGSCQQWGYFLNRHQSTLDQDGEWFYDSATEMLYLYSDSGLPIGIEASAIIGDPTRDQGGIVLGEDLGQHIDHVIIENFEVSKWYMHGISTPTNWADDDPDGLIIRDNRIIDVDAIGLNLAAWVFSANNGRDGWRGGKNLVVMDNFIRGAHHIGIDSYAQSSSFSGNRLEDIGNILTAGESGLGCGFDSGGGFCTEYGDGVRIKVHNVLDSGFGNTFEQNQLESIGHNGIDVFGPDNSLIHNTIQDACGSKGDCGAVRSFGNGNIATSTLVNLLLDGNIITDTSGNTDGCHPNFSTTFGFGIYLDHYTVDAIASDNTVVRSSASGLLVQNSTATVTDNTLFNNSYMENWRAQAIVTQSASSVDEFSGNLMYAQHDMARTLIVGAPSMLGTSDQNSFFNPYRDRHIDSQGEKTLSEWQTFSGLDANSSEQWFSLGALDPPLGEIFLNPTDQTVDVSLGGNTYFDLDQNPVAGTIQLAPFSSRILVLNTSCAAGAVLSG